MTGAALLAGYAAILGVAGPYLLKRLRWLERTPLLGIAVWLAALASMVVSLVLAGLLAAQATRIVHDLVADLIQACLHAFHHQYGSAPAAAIGGLVLASFLVVSLVSRVLAMMRRNRAARRRHLAAIDLVGSRLADLGGVTVIDHPAVIAYCVPGRSGRVVVTSAAIQELDSAELAAVVAHERAHLSGRHHLLVAAAGVVRAALPFVPLARHALPAVEYLVERLADERAARQHERYDVASALLAASAAKTPTGALGIGGSTVRSRVLQLIRPAGSLRWSCRLIGAATLMLLTVTPVLLVAVPAFGVAFADHCPFPDA